MTELIRNFKIPGVVVGTKRKNGTVYVDWSKTLKHLQANGIDFIPGPPRTSINKQLRRILGPLLGKFIDFKLSKFGGVTPSSAVASSSAAAPSAAAAASSSAAAASSSAAVASSSAAAAPRSKSKHRLEFESKIKRKLREPGFVRVEQDGKVSNWREIFEKLDKDFPGWNCVPTDDVRRFWKGRPKFVRDDELSMYFYDGKGKRQTLLPFADAQQNGDLFSGGIEHNGAKVLSHDGDTYSITIYDKDKNILYQFKYGRKCPITKMDPPNIGWGSYHDGNVVLLKSMGKNLAIPLYSQLVQQYTFECDVNNDYESYKQPSWTAYPDDIQELLRADLTADKKVSEEFWIGDGKYVVDFTGAFQERKNAGVNGKIGYKRPIRCSFAYDDAWDWNPPKPDLTDIFHKKYPMFPLGFADVPDYQSLTGKWCGSSRVMPDYMMSGVPSGLIDDLGGGERFFDWRKTPVTDADGNITQVTVNTTADFAQSNAEFVDYFQFTDARQKFERLCKTTYDYGVMLQKVGQPQPKMSVLYHASAMENIPHIAATGFANMGAPTGSMCGMGAYFAVHPHISYCLGNSRSGMQYIKYDSNGYGAVLVNIGVVIPGEYTYDCGSRTCRAGSGTRGTQNSRGICGGSFIPDKLKKDGTFPKENREVVFWWDKHALFNVTVGVAIVKRQ